MRRTKSASFSENEASHKAMMAQLAEKEREIASAREEIAKLERDVEFLSSNLAAEKSRVKVAESALGEANSHSAFVYRERAKALDDLATERAAREKAEAVIVEYYEAGETVKNGALDRGMTRDNDYARVNAANTAFRDMARAILAASAKEGEKR